MSFKAKTALLSFLSILLCSSAAFAVQGDICKFGDKNGTLIKSEARGFVMHQQSEIYRKYDVNCDGRLSPAELARYEKDQEPMVDQAKLAIDLARRDGSPVRVDAKGDTAEPLFGSTQPSPVSPSSNGFFYLRDSAEEIGVFEEPKPFTSATGASFSVSRDGVVGNTSWAAKGVVGGAYTWRNTERPAAAATPYVAGASSSAWMSFNWLSNSSAALKSKQADVLSFGNTEEIALANVLGATQYLRFKGAYNTDFESSPHSWSTTVEWQPVSGRYKLSSPFDIGPYLVGRVDPIVRFQHTVRLSGGSMDPIFSLHDEVSRAGPVLSLTVQPKGSDLILPNWIQNAVLNVTYVWLRDIDTSQKYDYLNASMAFPIDPSGHLAVKVNYQKGRLEETGARIDQAMAGISAKW
jgi:hypothetical protein